MQTNLKNLLMRVGTVVVASLISTAVYARLSDNLNSETSSRPSLIDLKEGSGPITTIFDVIIYAVSIFFVIVGLIFLIQFLKAKSAESKYNKSAGETLKIFSPELLYRTIFYFCVSEIVFFIFPIIIQEISYLNIKCCSSAKMGVGLAAVDVGSCWCSPIEYMGTLLSNVLGIIFVAIGLTLLKKYCKLKSNGQNITEQLLKIRDPKLLHETLIWSFIGIMFFLLPTFLHMWINSMGIEPSQSVGVPESSHSLRFDQD